MFWTCFGHVLDMCWTCFGHVWDMFGTCLGHVWYMFGTCFGYVSEVNFREKQMKVAKIEIVGNQWQELGIAHIDSIYASTFALDSTKTNLLLFL